MRTPIVLAAGLALALLVGALLVLSGAVGGEPPAGGSAESSEVTAGKERDAAAPEAELAPPREGTATVEIAPAARAAVSARPDAWWHAEDALWVSGTVVAPDGTPEGERIEVVADAGGLKDEDDHRAEVRADGSFAVAFRAGSHHGRLWIEADHLYLDGPCVLDPREPPRTLVLRPRLGALLAGRLVGAGASARRIEGTRVDIETAELRRRRAVESGARFVFRGLPPAEGARLDGDPEVFVPWTRTVDLRAGETTSVEVELARGRAIDGRVLDEDGGPIEGARLKVALRDAAGARHLRLERSDRDGRYALRGLAAEGSLEVRGRGFLALELDLADLLERASHDLVLVDEHALRGTVRFAGGEPAEGAVVTVRRNRPDGSPHAGEPVHAIAGEDGGFRAARLAEGLHRVEAVALRGSPVPAWSKSLEPEADWGHWSASLELRAPIEGPLDIALSPEPFAEIRVVDGSGEPIEPFRYELDGLRPEAPVPRLWGGRDRVTPGLGLGGVARVRLREGPYTATVTADGYGAAIVPFEIGAGSGAIEVVLERPGVLAGRVRFPGGDGGSAVVRLEVDGGAGAGAPRFSRFLWIGAEGRFRFEPVPAGRASLWAADSRGVSHRPVEVAIEPSGEIEDLELVLEPAARVRGRLLDEGGEPIAGAGVVALPEGWRTVHRAWLDVETDEDGRFEIAGAPLGPVRLVTVTRDRALRASILGGQTEIRACEPARFELVASRTIEVTVRLGEAFGRLR